MPRIDSGFIICLLFCKYDEVVIVALKFCLRKSLVLLQVGSLISVPFNGDVELQQQCHIREPGFIFRMMRLSYNSSKTRNKNNLSGILKIGADC